MASWLTYQGLTCLCSRGRGLTSQGKLKEAALVKRLKSYEVPKLQGPVPEPDELTGEERFYMKKMAQKGSNYVPLGRRGVFGGLILNMHLHWKKHETVKVICKPCKPGQVHEYAREIARLSGGTPIHVIGSDTIVFYRGKNYVQPEAMSPIDTLSKKRVPFSFFFITIPFHLLISPPVLWVEPDLDRPCSIALRLLKSPSMSSPSTQ